jgi:beta-glucosidase
MEPKELKFPEKFYWGAATAAHQVEGGNVNDWSEWEKANAKRLSEEASDKWQEWQKDQFQEMFSPNNYISGAACDHYNLFEKDFDIAKSLGHNAHRFSIEWSRIEPEEGKFNEKEIEHYRQVIQALKSRDIEPFVTLWHWTEPVWLGKMGGWTNKKSVDCFVRFVEKIVGEFKNDVKFWIAVNEPNVSIGFGYLLGSQPPGKKGPINFLRAYFNLLSAYKRAYRKIHEIDSGSNVSFAHSFTDYQLNIWKPINKLIVSCVKFFSNYFINHLSGQYDFVCCNYYSRYIIPFGKKNISPDSMTDLGWEIYPEGIYNVLKYAKKYNKPIYITENGLADATDAKRGKFITEHLKFVHQAISEGIDVRGYFHWSLLDNFEFPDMRGFWPRFGLVEVDYQTQERKIRPSAWEYKKIIENNAL